MQVQSLPQARAVIDAAAGPWFALALASSLLLLLLMFGGAIIGSMPPGIPLAVLAPWQLLVLLMLVGFLWANTLPASMGLTRQLRVLAFPALLWIAALLGYQQHYNLPGTPLILGVGLFGLTLGMTAGTLATPVLSDLEQRVHSDSNGPLAYLALACALIAALIPFATDAPLLSPFESVTLSNLPERVPQQIYRLIKGTMLWVPLGFLFQLAGQSRGLRRFVLAGVAGFFLVGWPFLDALRASDLLQVLYAPVGIWLGLWIGEQTARAYPSSQVTEAPVRATAIAEERPESTPTAPASPIAHGVVPGTEPDTTPGTKIASTFALPRPHLIALVSAIGLLVVMAWGWWDFPRFQLPVAAALALYLVLLAAFRHAWLVAIPALLPVLDLAPWTGRFFFDETDLFLLATLGAALLHRRDPQAGPFLARPVAVLGTAFATTTLVGLLIGVLPLTPLDANAFTTYFSHYNSLRVAKGFLWGLSFFLLLRWTVPRKSELPARLFTAGLMLGLLGVILIGVRERWQFADLLDFSAAYRITASFSSMHTGGSHLPAFLALAVPFVWLLVVRLRNLAIALFGLALFAGSAFLVVTTVTRASFLALAVEFVLLALFWFRGFKGRQARVAFSAVAFTAMGAVGAGTLYLGVQGGYFQHRLSMVERDADTRMNHWWLAVDMMDDGFATGLFGMGLGRFPEIYLQRNPLGLVPGNFHYASEAENRFLMLGSGETLYLAQRLSVEPDTQYRLAFDLRGTAPRLRLTMPLCEKHLLDSRHCRWDTHTVPGDGDWHHKEVILDSERVGEGDWLSRPPTEIFLFNGEKKQVVAVDNLSLRDPEGRELLRNGDFTAGGDFWFFKTHDHLAWHVKNLWVSMLFEQGWLGLIVFNLLTLAALVHLGGPAWRGSPVPAAAFTAVIGFLTVGLFASPFDAPRLTALFLAVFAIGLHATPALAVTASHRSFPLPRRRTKRRKSRPKSTETGKR